MSSYAHVADPSQASFYRGAQWWLMTEAKKRQPTMPLYCLSWGMPAWVGNGSTLSPGGVQYHIDYLKGAKAVHNLSFDYIGIWNEAPWSKEYVVDLRAALDSAGMRGVQIVAADGGLDVVDAAATDDALAAAIGAFGVHAKYLPFDKNIQSLDKPYFNSENDVVDGVLPQWGGANSPGLGWPLAFILNYVQANGTATMLCPGFHGWNQNLGRHNHGHSFFNDPWSGFYQLGAPFFSQAQFTRFTRIGWRFIVSGSGQRSCGNLGSPAANLTGKVSHACRKD
eukprot:m.256482 g.256482  ORF g.256482 m.256482 type:complete len:281 (+) comp19632_c0_seq12:72-914(+)